jgi:Domain of unknown function (DUF6457)
VNEWLRNAVSGMESDLELSPDEMRTLLDLAAYAAHESGNRVNAPLVCYLVGRLQGERDLDQVAEAVRIATS